MAAHFALRYQDNLPAAGGLPERSNTVHRDPALAMASRFAIKCEGLSILTLGIAGGYQREEIHRGAAQAMAAYFALKCEGLSILTLGIAGGYQREAIHRGAA